MSAEAELKVGTRVRAKLTNRGEARDGRVEQISLAALVAYVRWDEPRQLQNRSSAAGEWVEFERLAILA